MIYDSMEPVLDTVNLYQCESGFCTKERFIPNHYLLYVHRGAGQFVIDSFSYDAQAGDLFFCPRGKGNTIIASLEDPFLLSGIDFFFWKQEIGFKIQSNSGSEIRSNAGSGTGAGAGVDIACGIRSSTDSNDVSNADSDVDSDVDSNIASSDSSNSCSNTALNISSNIASSAGSNADSNVNSNVDAILPFFQSKINISQDHFALFTLQEMIQAFTNQTVISPSYCNTLLHAFLLNIIAFNEIRQNAMNKECNEVLQFITGSSDAFISIKETAQHFNYHPGTLNRMVKKVTGMTMKEYQIDIRMKKAMNLLLYSNRSIAEIAALCGYQSIFFFSRQFKAKTTFLPTKFRERKV